MNLLLSFWYYRDVDLDAFLGRFPEKPDVFVDSGAFSASRVPGQRVDVDSYAAWVKRWRHHITVFANLDVIGDPRATAGNQKRMEDMGLAPLPVNHATGDASLDFDRLAALCERYPYVCLGGQVGSGGNTLMPWLVRAFRIAEGTGTRFHGFGQTRAEVLRDLPWYSVDSSSWGSVYRYGGLSLWDDQRLKWVKVSLRDVKQVKAHYDLIRRYGITGSFVATAGRKDDPERVPRAERALLARASALAWQRYEAYLQKRHHVSPPAGLAGGDGPRVYLATEARFTNGTLDGLTGMGPKVYLADGHPENLLMGATGAWT